MPCGAELLTFACTRCHHVFQFPFLGEMTYGDAILHGERGSVHRYFLVFEHPAWNVVEAVLREQKREDVAMDVLVRVADPVDGQRFKPRPACPQCQADGNHFRVPESAPKEWPRVEVQDATFNTFMSLPSTEQRERILAAVREEDAESARRMDEYRKRPRTPGPRTGMLGLTLLIIRVLTVGLFRRCFGRSARGR